MLLHLAPMHPRGVIAECHTILHSRLLRGLNLSDSSAAQELRTRRTWDAAQHPSWLVFEVEGRLQIRPQQYTVAKTLMGHPGGWEACPIANCSEDHIPYHVVIHVRKLHDM